MKKKQSFTLLELLVLVAIIGGLMLLILPIMRTARERGRMVQCANNLRKLGVAALLCAAEHGGKVPDIAPDPSGSIPNLADSDYIKDESVYLCPSDSRSAEEFGEFKTSYTAYLFTPTSIYSKEASSERVMFVESDLAGKNRRDQVDFTDVSYRHGGLAVFAYADGHVATYYREQFPGVTLVTERTGPGSGSGSGSGAGSGAGSGSGSGPGPGPGPGPGQEPGPTPPEEEEPEPPDADFWVGRPAFFTPDEADGAYGAYGGYGGRQLVRVLLRDTSSGDVETRRWNCGNGTNFVGYGNTYRETSCIYEYDPSGTGIYTITLIVSGPAGSDSISRRVAIWGGIPGSSPQEGYGRSRGRGRRN